MLDSTLTDLDQIAIRVAHVATNLTGMIFWLSEELRSSAAPFFVTLPHISDSNIHEAVGRVGIFRRAQRHGRLIIRRPTADVDNDPAVGQTNERGLAPAHNFAAEDALIEIRRA